MFIRTTFLLVTAPSVNVFCISFSLVTRESLSTTLGESQVLYEISSNMP